MSNYSNITLNESERKVKSLRSLLKENGVYEHDPDMLDKNIETIQSLLSEGLLHELARDEAYVYYGATEKGERLQRDVEDRLRRGAHIESGGRSQVFKAKQSLYEDGPIDAPERFDENQSFSDYFRAGDALAKKYLDPEAYQGLNELYWDVAFSDKVPLHAAMMDLKQSAPALRRNSPGQIKRRYQSMISVTEDVLRELRNQLEPHQFVDAIIKEAENRGIRMDRQQAEQCLTTVLRKQEGEGLQIDDLKEQVHPRKRSEEPAPRADDIPRPSLRPGQSL